MTSKLAIRRLVAVVLSVLTVAASTASAQVTSGMVEVLGGITREIAAAPGDTVVETITVRNTGDEAVYVGVYFQNLLFDRDGSHTYSTEEASRSRASWLSGPAEPTFIPAGQAARLPVTITVPEDVSGAFWAAVLVRPEASVSQRLTINDRTNVPIQIITQYAGVFYVTVAGTGENSLVLEDPVITQQDGERVVQVPVRNEGDRADVFRVKAELFSGLGDSVRTEETLARLLGGYERVLEFSLQGIPAGQYTLIVTADAGQAQLFARQYTLQVP